MNSILLSRFILDLRSIYHTPGSITSSNTQPSSLHFVSRVEGNIGASLDASWATEDNAGGHDSEEEEEIYYSNNPLLTGLANPVQKNDRTQPDQRYSKYQISTHCIMFWSNNHPNHFDSASDHEDEREDIVAV